MMASAMHTVVQWRQPQQQVTMTNDETTSKKQQSARKNVIVAVAIVGTADGAVLLEGR